MFFYKIMILLCLISSNLECSKQQLVLYYNLDAGSLNFDYEKNRDFFHKMKEITLENNLGISEEKYQSLEQDIINSIVARVTDKENKNPTNIIDIYIAFAQKNGFSLEEKSV